MDIGGKKFEVILILLIVALFVVLQPKLSVVLFPQKRNAILSKYLDGIRTEKQIVSRDFWKFREFYYPGYFKLNKSGFKPLIFLPILDEIGVEFIASSNPSVFLLYQSDKVKSIEALVDKKTLNEIFVVNTNDQDEVIFEDETGFVDKYESGIRVLFVKPISDMVLTNGYFDYKNPRDQAIIENKYWLSASYIKIN